MALQAGIVGLPNVGKSTLFNALSSAKAQAANFPFCTIEPNVGVISVPDERLVQLESLVHPQQVIPTTVEIVDIAGLVKGASKGEGLGNQFLGNIRSTDAIIHVLRCFEDENVVHVDGDIDPVRDKEIIDTELQLKDIETVEKRIQRNRKQAKGGDKELLRSIAILEDLQDHLEKGQSARTFEVNKEDRKAFLGDLSLLTSKPIIYVCNVGEEEVLQGNAFTQKIAKLAKDEDAEVLLVSAAIESEIALLEDFEDRTAFLEDLGLEESGVSRLISSTYRLLSLITYFTAGEKEVRAWTIKKGMTAPQAAGVIHTDFEQGFIRAEVIHYKDFVHYGSEAACRDTGKLNLEGKEYIVQDGDVMHFRFNV